MLKTPPLDENTLAAAAVAPMADWQLAGLAFLLFKGGLNWLTGTYEVEGRQNLQTYLGAAEENAGLKLYLETVQAAFEADALTQDKPLQKRARAAQIGIREFIAAMNVNQPWTYCGTITTSKITKLAQMDSPV